MFGLMGLGMMQAEMGMLMGAEMGMMMGAGMGMRGMGYCPPGCMSSCCRRVIVCQPGCVNTCCVPRNVCQPGCTLPCCMNQQVIARTYQYAPPPPGSYTNDPYAPNRLLPMAQTPQPSYSQQNDIDRQLLLQQQAKINLEKRKQEEMAQKLRIEKEQLRLKDQEQQLRELKLKQDLEQREFAEQKARIQLNNLKMEQKRDFMRAGQVTQVQDYNRAPIEVATNPYLNQQSLPSQNQQNLPSQNQQQVLYQGDIYQKYGSEWRHISGAFLTAQSFVNIQIQHINKIKIKAQSQIKGTRLIKISTQTGEYFFSAFENQQVQWGLKLIWAKITSLGKNCSTNQPFKGHIEGEIVKKGFFSGWQPKYANVSGDALRISNQLGSSYQNVITKISELWTRFQFISGSLLVVKMHHNGSKVEMGIPTEHALVWLKGMCNLIRP